MGRVEIVPPLLKTERELKVMNRGAHENKVSLLTDENREHLTREVTSIEHTWYIEATLDKPFFIACSNRPFYLLSGSLYLSLYKPGRLDRAELPGGFKADIRPGDKAVYIGTLQYHRNEFFEITKVVIIDDYERANVEFRRKFGGRHTLRKALLKRAK